MMAPGMPGLAASSAAAASMSRPVEWRPYMLDGWMRSSFSMTRKPGSASGPQ